MHASFLSIQMIKIEVAGDAERAGQVTELAAVATTIREDKGRDIGTERNS